MSKPIKCSWFQTLDRLGYAAGFDSNCTVRVNDVISAVQKLKTGKSDGCIHLRSDYFLHACDIAFCSHFFTFLCFSAWLQT